MFTANTVETADAVNAETGDQTSRFMRINRDTYQIIRGQCGKIVTADGRCGAVGSRDACLTNILRICRAYGNAADGIAVDDILRECVFYFPYGRLAARTAGVIQLFGRIDGDKNDGGENSQNAEYQEQFKQ